MIRLISGVCRVGNKLMRPADKPFSITKEEEEYLVEQGVAKYVTEEKPAEGVATPPVDPDGAAAGVNSGNDESGADGTQGGGEETEDALTVVDGHYVKEELMKLTRPELNAMAESLGLDGASCDNKGQVADLICAIEVAGNDEGGQMPNLNPEDPVV